MLKHALMATAITFAAVSAQAQTVLISEGFDDFNSLTGNGWVLTNLSTSGGTSSWFQGIGGSGGIFDSQAGAPSAYIGADFNNSGIGGTISNWLISPTFSTAVAGTVSFWAKAAISAPSFDQIAFGLSTGSSTTGAFALGSTVTLVGAWTQYNVNFEAQGAGSVGRFAIEYIGSYDDSNYIGIDTFAVTTIATAPVPEPSTYALMALGLAGVAAVARRRRAAR
ncbi:MAG: choice-of-anchor J domain-containing protein [Burkholderiales bacterium]